MPTMRRQRRGAAGRTRRRSRASRWRRPPGWPRLLRLGVGHGGGDLGRGQGAGQHGVEGIKSSMSARSVVVAEGLPAIAAAASDPVDPDKVPLPACDLIPGDLRLGSERRRDRRRTAPHHGRGDPRGAGARGRPAERAGGMIEDDELDATCGRAAAHSPCPGSTPIDN